MRVLYERIIAWLKKWILIQHWEIILLFILMVAVLVVSKCFAEEPVGGMDFTGLGGDKSMVVPHFFNIQQAVDFGIEVKWNEEALQELRKRRAINLEYAYHSTKGWMLLGQRQDGNMYHDQWKWNDTAVAIVERFKLRGQRGDSAMTSFDDFKSASDAIAWGHIMKWQEHIRLNLVEHIAFLRTRSKVFYPQLSLQENLKRQLPYKEQLAYCSVALAVVEDYKTKNIPGNTNFGSTFYAGSEPVYR